jgi:peptidoglycan-associated lipoprotein
MVMNGCAKKSVVKGEAVTTEEKAAVETTGKDVVKKGETASTEAAREKVTTEGEATSERAASTEEKITLKDIYFEFDKFNLKPEAREALKKYAENLTQNKNHRVLIEGHCDERGTTEYNLALGERRAKEAMKYFVELGIDGKRIKTISYGKERPLDPGNNEEAWAKNRRDHFVVTPKK